MPKEQLEHISIIMEIIAFFFVTIDLYGRERLELLQTKIASGSRQKVRTFIKRKGDMVFDAIFKDNGNWGEIRSMLIVAIPTMAVFFFVIKYMARHLQEWGINPHSSSTMLIFIAAGLLIFLLSMAAIFITSYLLYWVLRGILLTIFGIAQSLLRLSPIEGMMLLTGAVLFITAKLMLYFSK